MIVCTSVFTSYFAQAWLGSCIDPPNFPNYRSDLSKVNTHIMSISLFKMSGGKVSRLDVHWLGMLAMAFMQRRISHWGSEWCATGSHFQRASDDKIDFTINDIGINYVDKDKSDWKKQVKHYAAPLSLILTSLRDPNSNYRNSWLVDAGKFEIT